MRSLFLLLLLSFSDFAICQGVEGEKLKRNLLGIDVSAGKSVAYFGKGHTGFSGALNYGRVSKSTKWHFEFGVRYTQLNFNSNRYFKTHYPSGIESKDTFYIRTSNIMFFDLPINFKRNLRIGKKTNLQFTVGCFYTTYIKWIKKTKSYLFSDESFIKQENGLVKPFNYFKMGLDFGFGVSRNITTNSSIYFSGHLNTKFELDIFGDGYFYPNLEFGYRIKI